MFVKEFICIYPIDLIAPKRIIDQQVLNLATLNMEKNQKAEASINSFHSLLQSYIGSFIP